MKYTKKKTFFQDIIIFINKIKDISYIRGAEFIYGNL